MPPRHSLTYLLCESELLIRHFAIIFALAQREPTAERHFLLCLQLVICSDIRFTYNAQFIYKHTPQLRQSLRVATRAAALASIGG